LNLRRVEEALSVGSFELLDLGPQLLGFKRTHEGRAFTVILNFSGQEQAAEIAEIAFQWLLLSTHARREPTSRTQPLRLRGYEGLILGPPESAARHARG